MELIAYACNDSNMHPLRVIGLTATAEDIYLALVQRGPAPPAGLASTLRVTPDAVRAAADELTGLGLLEPDGERLVARPRGQRSMPSRRSARRNSAPCATAPTNSPGSGATTTPKVRDTSR